MVLNCFCCPHKNKLFLLSMEKQFENARNVNEYAQCVSWCNYHNMAMLHKGVVLTNSAL